MSSIFLSFFFTLFQVLDPKSHILKDGLSVCQLNPRQTELMKKKICKIVQDNDLKITIEANKKNVNFLDVNFDLTTGIYKPYMKPNDQPRYVHQKSNHPPSILKNIPKSVNKRLSSISANEEVFKAAIPPFQESLHQSGYNFELKYTQCEPSQEKRRQRTRPVTPHGQKMSRQMWGANF